MNGQLFSSSGSANDTPTPPSNNSYPASLSSQSSRDASPSHGPRPGPNGANGPFQPLYRSSPYGQQISPNYPAQHSGYQQTDPKRPPWNDNNRPMTTAPHLASSMNQTTKLPSNPTSSATTPLAKVETTQVLSQNLGYNRPVINNRFPGSNFNVTPAPPSSNYGQMNAVSKSSEHLNSAPQFQSDSYLVNNQTLNNVSGYSDPMQNSSSRSSVTHDSPVLHQTTTSSASLNSSLGHLNSSPTPPPAKDHLQPYNDRELPTSSSSSPVQQVLHQNNSQNSSLYSTVQKMPGDGSSKATGRTEIHQQDDLFPVVGRQYNFHSSELNNDPESNSSVDNAEPSPAKIPAGELWPQNLHSTVAGGDFSEREDGNKPEVKPFVNHSNSHPSSVMQQASTTNPTISQSSSVERFTKPSAQNIQTFASNQSNPANVSPFSQANFYRPPNSTSNIPSSSHFPPTQEVNHISAVTGSQTNVAPNLTQDTGPGRYSPAVNTSRLPPLGATSASNIAPPTPTVNFGQTSASNLPPSTKYVPPTAAANFTPPPTSSTSFIPPPTSATNVSSSSSLIPSGLNSGRSTTNFAPPTSGSNFSPPPSSASNFAPQTSGSTAVHPQTTGPNFVPPKSGSNFAPTSAASFAPSSSSNFTPPTLGQNFANPNSGSNFAPQNSGSNFAPPKSAASFASPTSTANYAPPTSASNIASPPTSGSNFVPPPTSASNFAPLPTSGSNFAHPPTSASNIAPPPTSASNFAPPTSGSNFPNPASSASNFAPPPTSGSKFATPSSRFTPPPTAAPNFAPPSTSGSNFGPPASAAGFAPPTSAANNFAPPNFAPPPTSGSKFAPPSSRFTPPPTAAPNFAPPSTSGSNFGPPASTAGFAPPRPAANNFAPPTSAAKFAPPSANYPPSSNYMPAATPRQQQFGGPPPVMSQPRPNMTPFQNQFQNRYPPSSAPGMQQQQNQFAPPNSYGPPPAAPYGNQQQANIAAGPYRQSPAQFQQMRPPQPGMMDSLTNQFRAASVTQEGYNRLWGMDTLDLLKTRDLLSKDKTEAPTIRLNPEMFDAPNCSPELFRCTLAKIPESKSLLEKSRLPLGVLIHPFKDLNQLSVIQCTTIVRCRTCRTYINPFVYFVDNKRWKCNLCFRVNELPEEFQFDPLTKTYGDPSRRPEIRSATIEFIAPSEYMVRPPQPAIYLFLLDVSRLGAECGYLSVVCQTLLDELDNLPGDARTSVGFITYDSSVHFYSLAEGLNRPHQMTVVDIDDMFLPSPDNLIVNLSENIDLVRDLLTNLPTQYAESYDTESALGAALQAAYKLLAPTGGRVTVFQARLPSIGPGALTAREDPSQRAGDSVPHLNPSTDFYKKLALDCSGQQVAVDIFFVNSQYVDIATLSGVSRFSGGCMHHFPLFRAVDLMHVKILKKCLRRYLSRKIGFESVMRLRCTRGLSVHTFHGNFFVRSTDLLSLPNVNPDAGFGMQVSIDENLSELQTVCFQAALLYTSSKGERRIRVHTLCLPIANSLSDVLNSADQLCIIGLLSKMAVDRSMESSISDAREAFVNVAADILSAYRLTQSSAPHGSLLAAHTLRLIPLYILALLKFVAFRIGQSTRLDDRVFAMCQLKSMPLAQLLQLVYPDLYPIHDLEKHPVKEVGPEKEKVHDPPRLQLSAERVDSHGVYLLDSGHTMIVYVGHNCPAALCQALFGAPSFTALPHESFDLPELDTAESDRLFAFIHHLCSEKAYVPCIQVIRDDSHHRMKFLEQLVEDKNEAGTSYYEFLQRIKQLGK